MNHIVGTSLRKIGFALTLRQGPPPTVSSVGGLWCWVALGGDRSAGAGTVQCNFFLLGGFGERAGDAAFFRRNIMFQLANVPSSRPPDPLRPTHLIGAAASMFMLCSTKIRWLSQAISGTALCIPQLNRIIFVNNSLILAKGRSARLSRRRRWDFRPSRGKPAARARVRARFIGGKLTSENGGNAGFLPCYFPF
jgi:hypothetical protein